MSATRLKDTYLDKPEDTEVKMASTKSSADHIDLEVLKADSESQTTDKDDWTTTRAELWSFYVYYIVSQLRLLNLAPDHCGSAPTSFSFVSSAKGKQRSFRLQLRTVSIPKSALLGRV